MVKRAQFNSALEEIAEVTKAMGHPMKSHKTSSIYAIDIKQLQKTHNDTAELFGLIVEAKEKKQLSLF